MKAFDLGDPVDELVHDVHSISMAFFLVLSPQPDCLEAVKVPTRRQAYLARSGD